jgi:hypothetical protein
MHGFLSLFCDKSSVQPNKVNPSIPTYLDVGENGLVIFVIDDCSVISKGHHKFLQLKVKIINHIYETEM